MNSIDDYTLLTTNQAAQLISVHESSIKRWCKDGELPCDITEGGHRRIHLPALLAFADRRQFSSTLATFSSHAPIVWNGLRLAQSKGSFALLFETAYKWLAHADQYLFSQLLSFCLELGMSFSTLFDEVIARSLHQIGEDWQKNELDVGTEHLMTEIIKDELYRIRLNFLHTPHKNGSGKRSRQSFAYTAIQPENKDKRAIVGCNAGNQHDLGAQAIRLLLEKRGWEVIYLGPNVPVNDFAALQVRYQPQLLCISFVSSNMMSEAERFIDVLGRFYDAESPYHLAIGGHFFPDDATDQLPGDPFESLQVYRTIGAFEEWLNDR